MNRKSKYVLLASAAAFTALPLAANATPITPYVGSQANVAFYDSSTNNQVGSSVCSPFSSTPGATVGCSGSTATPTGSTLNYLTTATAGYGILKAGGSSSNTGASGTTNLTDYSSAVAQAYFADSWTITGGTGTGTLQLKFALDGSYDFSQVYSGLQVGLGLVNLDSHTYSSANLISGPSNTISNTYTLTTEFTFGTPLDFQVTLTAGSLLYDLGNDISSYADFSDTALMNTIVVTDANGNVIPFNLATGSGAPLFAQLAPSSAPTSVPEPSSLALFGAGLIALLGFSLGYRRGRST